MKRVLTALGLPLFSLVAVSPLRAQVTELTIMDGSYSEMCEQAARRLDRSSNVQVTGTRLNVSPIELCTIAIREDASGYNRAANYNNRGVLLFAEGRLDEALRDFERAIQLRDGLASAHANRGFALGAMERWAEAVEALDRGIELGFEDPARAHFSRAAAHEELGHIREAYEDYRKAAELDPLWEEPRLELSRFRVSGG